MNREKPKPIQLLFTADEHYAVRIPTVLKSLQLSHPGRSFHIHLICDGLSEPAASALRDACERMGFALFLYPVSEELFSDAPITKHYSKAMYYRMLASRILPPTLDRVLYLDPDVLVINSLEPLWSLELNGYMFAATSHGDEDGLVSNVNRIRLDTVSAYYNTGVLLMDLAQCRREIRPAEIFSFIRENEHKLLLPDQDVFNALFGSRTLLIPDEIWNYDARKYSYYLLRSGGKTDEAWVIRNTAVLHFCGKEKPWKPHYRYRFGLLYRHYEQLCIRDKRNDP